jgi:hypothetical protein
MGIITERGCISIKGAEVALVRSQRGTVHWATLMHTSKRVKKCIKRKRQRTAGL